MSGHLFLQNRLVIWKECLQCTIIFYAWLSFCQRHNLWISCKFMLRSMPSFWFVCKNILCPSLHVTRIQLVTMFCFLSATTQPPIWMRMHLLRFHYQLLGYRVIVGLRICSIYMHHLEIDSKLVNHAQKLAQCSDFTASFGDLLLPQLYWLAIGFLKIVHTLFFGRLTLSQIQCYSSWL